MAYSDRVSRIALDTLDTETIHMAAAPTPSVMARQALRDALRAHPNSGRILQGRNVSNLRMSELLDGLRALGMDPDTITGQLPAPVTTPAANPTELEVTPDMLDTLTALDTDTLDTDTRDTVPDAIETEVQSIRELVIMGGFAALDARLRELVTEARKPPVTVTVEVPVPVDGSAPAPLLPQARQTSQTVTWSKAFGVRGALGKEGARLWDGAHPDTPETNARYIWPQPQTALALTQIRRGRNVMLYGPAGTGKTEFAQQLAARLGRPFALISCDSGTDAATLVGMTVPHQSGGVVWQDGQLTRAIRTPGCVVCLDEPSVARPGALFVFQNVLANRVLFLGETGQRVRVAPGVLFIATDNTNGTGGGAKRGYTDTNRLNTAFLDRFGTRIFVDYMDAGTEARIVASYTGCTPALAELLVSAATTTRAAAGAQTVTHGIGLRRLLAWAELLSDGVAPEDAFAAAVLNCAPEQDVEALRQQCLLAYDKNTVRNALLPPGTPTPSAAASEFDVYPPPSDDTDATA